MMTINFLSTSYFLIFDNYLNFNNSIQVKESEVKIIQYSSGTTSQSVQITIEK